MSLDNNSDLLGDSDDNDVRNDSPEPSLRSEKFLISKESLDNDNQKEKEKKASSHTEKSRKHKKATSDDRKRRASTPAGPTSSQLSGDKIRNENESSDKHDVDAKPIGAASNLLAQADALRKAHTTFAEALDVPHAQSERSTGGAGGGGGGGVLGSLSNAVRRKSQPHANVSGKVFCILCQTID
jgi:hypothetical protein